MTSKVSILPVSYKVSYNFITDIFSLLLFFVLFNIQHIHTIFSDGQDDFSFGFQSLSTVVGVEPAQLTLHQKL